MSSERSVQFNAAEILFSHSREQALGAAPAVEWLGRTYTYAQMEKLVDCFGNALLDNGLGPGDRMLCLLTDSPVFIAAYLGAIKIGAVAIAYNVRASRDDLLHAINDSACKILLIDDEFYHLYEGVVGQLANKPRVVVVGEEMDGAISVNDLIAGKSRPLEPVPVARQDTAFWVYTSGTSGRPKAAMHAHGDLAYARAYMEEVMGVRQGDRVFASSKLFFTYALAHSLFGTLAVGGTAILYDAWPDTGVIADLLADSRPDVVLSVPTFYRNLMRDEVTDQAVLRRVRSFFCSGEQLPVALNKRWEQHAGMPILEGIGSSETLFPYLSNRPGKHRIGSCGHPVPGVELSLRDLSGKEVDAAETEGVLWVGSPTLFTGYWQRPDAEERVLQDGWYNTGDRFRRDAEGWWYFLGRADDMLKISGHWVSPLEVEQCALTVDSVDEAALVGVTNEDGLVRATLLLVSSAQSNLQDGVAAAVKARLLDRLSPYKCPSVFRFVAVLPRSANGKLLRNQLPTLL